MSTNDNADKLTIIKTVDRENIYLEENANYTITITNTGDTTLTNLKLTDTINEKLLLVPNSIKINSVISPATEINNLILNDLDINSKAIITYSARAINIGQNVINNATINATYNHEQIEKTSDDVLINIYSKTTGAVLFTKEVDKTFCRLNDTIHFILKFKNIGTVDLENIHLADNFDDMLTYVENSTKIDNVVTGNIIEDLDFAKLLIGEEHRIDFSAITNTVYDKIPNTAVMAAYYDEKILNPITNEVYIKVLDEPIIQGTLDLSIPKNNYLIGDIIPVTITLTNTGNISYNEVTITDILPLNLEFVQDSLQIDGNKFLNKDLKDGIILNNIDFKKIITFNVKAQVIGTNIQNNAAAIITYVINDEVQQLEITSNEINLNIGEEINPILEIEKTAYYTDLHINDITTITLRLKNMGNILLSNINVYDLLPEGLEFVNGSLKIDYASADGDINKGIKIPDMEIDYVTFVTFDVKATKSINLINNQAYATYNYITSDTKKNSLVTSNTLVFKITEINRGHMEINKTSNKNTYILNEDALFSFVVINTGNTDNYDTIVKDELPNNYQFIPNSIKVDGNYVDGDINNGINIGIIPKNSFKIVDFTAKSSILGNNIYNEIVCNFKYKDNNGNELLIYETSNSNITNIHEPNTVNLTFKKEAYREEITLNDDNIFRLTIENTGSLKITDTTITDNLSNEYQFKTNSVKINGVNNTGNITQGINIGDIEVGDKVLITFEATGILLKKHIENKANINYNYTSNNQTINENQHSNIIITNIIEDIDAIVIIDATSTYPTTYLTEENTFVLNVQNIGNINVSNLLIKNMLDDHYTFVSDSLKINGEYYPGDITQGIIINFLNASETKLITFNVIGKVLGNNIKNITSSSYKFNNILNEPVTENIYSNKVLTDIVIKKEAILKLDKTSSKQTLFLNEINEFTVTITNIGNTDAYEINAIDNLPNNYEYLDTALKTGIFIDRITPNETKTITYSGKAIKVDNNILNKANATYKYKNSLNIKINEFATSNDNITNIVTKSEANIEIVKRQAKTNLLKKETNTFYIELKNLGNGLASEIVVKDILPNNYAYVENTLRYNNNLISGDIIDGLEIDDLLANDMVTISFDAMAKSTGKNIKNIAQVSYFDLNKYKTTNSNELISNISISKLANLSLEKSIYPTTYHTDDIAKYKIIVKNMGNCPAENIILSDILPIELQFINGSISINGNKKDHITNENIIIDNINELEKVTVEFDVLCLTKNDTVNNIITADYTYNSLDNKKIFSHAISNTSTISIKENDNPNLVIEQTVTKNILSLWEINNFTFKFINNGNVNLSNITLYNYLINNYNLIKDSLKIDGISYIESDLKNILIGDLGINNIKTLTFQAYANIASSNILNVANSTFRYIENNKVVSADTTTNEVITTITDEETASIVVDTNMVKTVELYQEIPVNLVVTNKGDINANIVNIQSQIDDAFEMIPNSLIIDGVLSNEDLLIGLSFLDVIPNRRITIQYRVKALSVKNPTTINTNINYEYTDINDIIRKINNQIKTTSRIIQDISSNISINKDSKQTNYLKDDIVTFRIIITNNSDVPLIDNRITDILPNNYEFITNSIKIDGNIKSGNINDGIDILKINSRNNCIITFEAKANSLGENIANTANINYSYEINGNLITENIDSLPFNTNIFANIKPIINISKEQTKKNLKKNDINTYTIKIYNEGAIDIKDLNILDVLDEHYNYILNSLKVNDVLVNDDPSYIFINELKNNSNIIITFEAIAIQSGENVINMVNIQFDYINGINRLVNLYQNSNDVISNIYYTTKKEIIDLINTIADEENGIAILIEKEKLKLETILNNCTDKEMILRINSSISRLMQILTIKEENSYSKIKGILKNIL